MGKLKKTKHKHSVPSTSSSVSKSIHRSVCLSVCLPMYLSIHLTTYPTSYPRVCPSVRPFIFVRQITHSSASATTALPNSSSATDDPVYIILNRTMLDRPYVHVWSVEKKNGLNTNCSSNYVIYLTKWLHM